jgi:hypothetical protein
VSAVLFIMALAAISVLGTTAVAEVEPVFDTASYCLGIEQSSDAAIRQPFLSCKVREDTIKPQISEFWAALTEKDRKDCIEVANYAGGSYTVLFICTTKALDLYGLRADGSDPVVDFRHGQEVKP